MQDTKTAFAFAQEARKTWEVADAAWLASKGDAVLVHQAALARAACDRAHEAWADTLDAD